MTTYLFLVLALVVPLQTQGWHGLVPLRSTRADVEQLLGPPLPGTKGSYKTERERVLILYSDEPCGINSGGWNVPRDTVVSITVEPYAKPKFVDIHLDESKYQKERDYHLRHIFYYGSKEEGISYEVDTAEGVVNAIRYFPTVKDDYLLCPPSIKLSESIKETLKVNEYTDMPFESEKKRLDSFVEQLHRYASTQAYMMVYAGRRARAGEAEARAERAKEYLVKGRGIDAKHIVTIDGGHREELTVELYLVPPGATPPLSTPTVDPSKVQIIKDGSARNNRRSPQPRRKQRQLYQ